MIGSKGGMCNRCCVQVKWPTGRGMEVQAAKVMHWTGQADSRQGKEKEEADANSCGGWLLDTDDRDLKAEVAVALEKAALSDEYFVKRKLYPNVDFYSDLIYNSMGFPTEFFPVLFAIPRMAGYLA
ncbi:hypothetical protein AAC387_Pa03g1551 [Persea americana]